MADDLHFVGGDFYRICDRTGFKVRARHTAEEWNGRIVRDQSWERRNQQEYVRGIRDDQTVPDPRPRQPNVGVGPAGTTTTAAAAIGAVLLHVVATTGFTTGDRGGVVLDDGTVQYVTIGAVDPLALTVGVSALRFTAASGNEIWDYGS